MGSLIFDFPDPQTGRTARTVYRDPVRVVSALHVSDVLPALAEVEDAVARGLHAAGFLSYEAAPAFEPHMRVRSGSRLPLLWFGLFAAPVATTPTPAALSPPAASRALRLSRWTLELERSRYDASVAAVRAAIAEGRTYQVNLTARLRAELERGLATDAVSLYESLRRAQGPGWHALLDLGRQVVVSVSPELFFRTSGRRIETRPMKGTRPRGRWPEEDSALAAELVGSEKDRAENLMIVDLLRNDLGRVCETGSVQVPRLFDVERYRTVWQLTSSVEGRLREGVGLTGIMASLFPCGSVTGAPKISTMELIAELEASPREIYCGAMGMVRPGGDMAFNVPIRTLWWERDTGLAEYGTGGGIVWDSTADAEYHELLAKAVVIREPWPEFELLETMAAESGSILRLDRHLDRLARSADYFGFPFPEPQIRRALADVAGRTAPREATGEATGHTLRIRLTLAADGSFVIGDHPLGLVGAESPEPPPVSEPRLPVDLAELPVRSTDRFLFHKTTQRAPYEARRALHPRAFDVLLHNESDEVTEFTRGNVVVELGGRRVTPPLEAGLLPGCFRADLLAEGIIEEATIRMSDLHRASRVWFINSARRWIEVALPTAI